MKIFVSLIGKKFSDTATTTLVCCLHSLMEGNAVFQFKISENKVYRISEFYLSLDTLEAGESQVKNP